jgi:hypothetical protein
MTTLETLKAARQTLTPLEAWTKGDNARDQDGARVDPQDPRATCWCLIGAIAMQGHYSSVASYEIRQTLVKDGRCDSIAAFNDDPDTTHDDVLGLLDKTIARLEA